MDWNKTGIAIIGLIITVLSTLGVVTGDEGAALTTNGTAILTGVLGLVSTILAIVKRRKEEEKKDGQA